MKNVMFNLPVILKFMINSTVQNENGKGEIRSPPDVDSNNGRAIKALSLIRLYHTQNVLAKIIAPKMIFF
jgi:hypothetical protein